MTNKLILWLSLQKNIISVTDESWKDSGEFKSIYIPEFANRSMVFKEKQFLYFSEKLSIPSGDFCILFTTMPYDEGKLPYQNGPYFLWGDIENSLQLEMNTRFTHLLRVGKKSFLFESGDLSKKQSAWKILYKEKKITIFLNNEKIKVIEEEINIEGTFFTIGAGFNIQKERTYFNRQNH